MIIVIEHQSLIDIAIQQDGNALSAFDWADVNNISITDLLLPGQKLIVPKSIFRNNDIVDYFNGKQQLVATAGNFLTIEKKQLDFSFPLGEFPFSF
jgi:hypothetical protein